jgi:hypothetical protein
LSVPDLAEADPSQTNCAAALPEICTVPALSMYVEVVLAVGSPEVHKAAVDQSPIVEFHAVVG